MSRVPPLKSTNLQVQTTQVSKNQLSNTDRKVSNSPIIREIIISLAAFVALDIVVISCIVSPVLLCAVVPAILIVVYRIFAASQQPSLPPPQPQAQPLILLNLDKPAEISYESAPLSPRSFAGCFTGLNRRYNECFINSALQFLQGSPLYADIISNNPQFAVLKRAHDGIRASIQNHQLISDVDTHDVRMWLYDSVKGTKNEISADGQEDTSVLLEELFGAAYPELPLLHKEFRPGVEKKEEKKAHEQLKWIDLSVDSSDFVTNFNKYFWEIPERSDSEIKENKPERNKIRQFRVSPEDYFIRLKRYDNYGQKINKDVIIPETFEHKQGDHTIGENTTYEVDRFIQHRGYSLLAGHYVTFKKVLLDGQPVYLEFDDTSIREVTKTEYLEQLKQAYWLHVCKVQ
jgi:hypothetical protein